MKPGASAKTTREKPVRLDHVHLLYRMFEDTQLGLIKWRPDLNTDGSPRRDRASFCAKVEHWGVTVTRTDASALPVVTVWDLAAEPANRIGAMWLVPHSLVAGDLFVAIEQQLGIYDMARAFINHMDKPGGSA